MSICNPKALHAALQGCKARPRRHFSQNFLADGNIARKIVTGARLSAKDTVLEIGPGLGALTELLLATEAKVVAVEKDKTLAAHLRDRWSNHSRFELFEGDIRDFPLECLPKQTKVVSNLPYHLTSPILGMLLARFDLFSELFLMVQYEVAERMTARARCKDFSLLTLFVNFYCHAKIAFKVSRNVFYPIPNVDSAIVHLVLREPPLSDAADFFRIAKMAFGQRRKMVKSTLKKDYGQSPVTEALVRAGLSPQVRPEEMSLEEWLDFYLQMLP